MVVYSISFAIKLCMQWPKAWFFHFSIQCSFIFYYRNTLIVTIKFFAAIAF